MSPSIKPTITLICPNCKGNFQKLISHYNKVLKKGAENVFCSKSCSASFNNTKHPKRNLKGKCKKCKVITSSSRTYCKTCFQNNKNDYSKITLQELKQICGSRNSYSTTLRYNARKILANAGLLSKCFFCPYKTKVHAHHIRPVSTFPLTSALNEVNNLNNLIGVCPNCHTDIHEGVLLLT